MKTHEITFSQSRSRDAKSSKHGDLSTLKKKKKQKPAQPQMPTMSFLLYFLLYTPASCSPRPVCFTAGHKIKSHTPTPPWYRGKLVTHFQPT